MQEMVPKYYTVEQKIVEAIDGEIFQANQMIPSERELMERFGVSRITVRKALDDLVNEGYLFRIQGKGTFVKGDEFNQDLFQLTSCTEEIRKMGMIPTKRVLASGIITADKIRQRSLRLQDGEKLFYLRRVYYADGQPLNLTTTYLPICLFPNIEKYDFSVESIYDVLEKQYGAKITTATRTLEAVLVKSEVADELDMEENAPVLLFRGVTQGKISGAERPIEVFKSYYRSDKFKFFINQAR